jgi:hypothetical protein
MRHSHRLTYTTCTKHGTNILSPHKYSIGTSAPPLERFLHIFCPTLNLETDTQPYFPPIRAVSGLLGGFAQSPSIRPLNRPRHLCRSANRMLCDALCTLNHRYAFLLDGATKNQQRSSATRTARCASLPVNE